jgi:VCBS repeat-containing protein
MGTLKPEGDEPFNLPLAQQVRAMQNGDLVALSFTVSFTGGALQKVEIEMTKDKAVTLLGELKRALTTG